MSLYWQFQQIIDFPLFLAILHKHFVKIVITEDVLVAKVISKSQRYRNIQYHSLDFFYRKIIGA